jgi:hypothetical protein
MACPDQTAKWCWCLHTVELNLNELVEVILSERDDGEWFTQTHSVHLHGHKFAVLAQKQVNQLIFHSKTKLYNYFKPC